MARRSHFRPALLAGLVALILIGRASRVAAEDLLPADTSIENAIDHYIEARLTKENVSPAPLADDANVLRRTMLDLVGRPPTAAEAKAYLADTNPDKRTALVDRLLETKAFIRQQADEFDAMLMRSASGNIREYLTKAFEERRSWDRMFRELIVGEPEDAEQKGAITFVKARVNDVDKLTAEASVAFFGVDVSCAKCHDHPLVSDWTQEHYYGMKSFFSRSFDLGNFVGEREYGLVEYKTVEGESRTARLMFLTGEVLTEPEVPEPDEDGKKEEKKRLEELKKSKQPPPAPSFSRRAKLVEAALASEKADEPGFFARSIVNHVWARLLGRGIVSPADQLHSENTPSHPELLTWLARDMHTHGYDLRRLIRGIVLSRAYARSSRWDSAEKRPADELFAVGSVRPLKPWQYSLTLRLASANPDSLPAVDGATDDQTRRLQQLEESGRNLGNIEYPGDDFQVSVDEALLLSNAEKAQKDLLSDGKSSILGKLETIDDPRVAAETALWNAFAREPAAEEIDAVATYLSERADRLPQARKQIVWALLTSSELRFNY